MSDQHSSGIDRQFLEEPIFEKEERILEIDANADVVGDHPHAITDSGPMARVAFWEYHFTVLLAQSRHLGLWILHHLPKASFGVDTVSVAR
jgi:hypothetical protein